MGQVRGSPSERTIRSGSRNQIGWRGFGQRGNRHDRGTLPGGIHAIQRSRPPQPKTVRCIPVVRPDGASVGAEELVIRQLARQVVKFRQMMNEYSFELRDILATAMVRFARLGQNAVAVAQAAIAASAIAWARFRLFVSAVDLYNSARPPRMTPWLYVQAVC